jgi:hypothetical protein
MHYQRLAATPFLAVTLIACGPDLVAPSQAAPHTMSAHSAFLPIDVLGSSHVPPGQACKAAGYRQFDFWVGQWDVRGPAGGLAGTNIVSSKLGGCVIEESWTGAGGGHGRSLNFYDASNDTWSQMWVSSGGCSSGLIVVEGTFANGSMTMRGRKEQPDGFLLGPPCAAPPGVVAFAQNTLIRWTALPSGSVLQQFTGSINNNPLPEPPPPSSGVGLRYDRVGTVTPLTPPDPSFCPTRAQARQFDFMIGSWNVHQGEGNGAQGTVTFSKDLRDCLVEEVTTGPGNYEGWSFNTFDPFTQKWHRTYLDTDGTRLRLTGGLVNGAMVLRGSKQGTMNVEVRVSWIPGGVDRVVQRWEVSRDGGADWTNARELVYTRQ